MTARRLRIAVTYAMEVGVLWLDVVDDVIKAAHIAVHTSAVVLDRASRKVDPDL